MALAILITTVPQYIYTKWLLDHFFNYDFKLITVKKLESQRYKRICETVQEGILIMKGHKIKFINEIFQNLQYVNKNKKIQHSSSSPGTSRVNFLNKKIFYIYSRGGEHENEGSPNSQI